jgi:hypothetical protein
MVTFTLILFFHVGAMGDGNSNATATVPNFVSEQGVTKIVCYAEKGGLDFTPYLAVYKGDVLFMRTHAIGKEIVYT